MIASGIVELRQYTLHPGRREVLIELFDRELVESQEALGMQVLGQFRDLDDPDRFVWLRGFADMGSRHRALVSFYGGPVWAEHRDAANATMIDSNDVLLLRAATARNFPCRRAPRRPVGRTDQPQSLVAATVYRLAQPGAAEVLDLLTRRVEPLLTAAGAPCLALLETEPATNTFTALPVREGERVLVTFRRFDHPDGHTDLLHRLAASAEWQASQRQLRPHLLAAPQQLRLQPTARSLLR